MKKIALGALALLVAALTVVMCLNIGLPEAEALENTAALTESGSLYLAENRLRFSRIYRGDGQGRISWVYQESRRDGGWITTVTHVAAGGRGIYFVRQLCREDSLSPSDWQLCLLNQNGTVSELGGGAQVHEMRITDLSVAYGQVLVSGVTEAGTGALCTLPEAGGEWALTEEGGDGTVRSAFADGSGLIVLLEDGRTVGFVGGHALEREPPVRGQRPEEISLTLKARIQCKRELLAGAAILVCCVFLLALVIRWAGKSRSLALRTTLVAGGCLLLALALAGGGLTASMVSFRADASLESLEYLAQTRAQLVSGTNPAAVLRSDYCGSEDAARMEQIMAAGDELYALREDGTQVALSRRLPWGTAVEEALDTEVQSLVARASRGETAGTLIFRQGRRLAVCAVPVTSSGISVGVLVCQAPAELNRAAQHRLAAVIGVILAAVFVVALVLLYCFLRRATKPIRSLTRQMRAVSDGNLTACEIPNRRDELGEMSRAMQEMCMGLSIRDYEVDAVVRSYRRFIPRDLERLLDRATVMEVDFGDAKTITGSVGLFTVCNRDSARTALEDAGYVSFVSDSCSLLRESVQAHRGQLLSANFDLSMVPVLYPNTPSDGVQAGMRLMGELDRRGSADGWTPDFFLMLHYATFLYGIAGTEEQVFPFLSSAEMEFLGQYADRFRTAGVRMVLTEPFLQRISIGCTTRHIGFITSPDGKYTYKLHEALDTYPDIERNLRIRYDQRFQEGIHLFYHNDFYLARNIFSALLKVCPRDGIVRWYLFACEHFFHSDPEQCDYQLFGVDH